MREMTLEQAISQHTAESHSAMAALEQIKTRLSAVRLLTDEIEAILRNAEVPHLSDNLEET